MHRLTLFGLIVGLCLAGPAARGAGADREHHVRFAHTELRKEFFSDPPQFVQTLREPLGETFLFYVWQQLGKRVAKPLKHSEVGRLPGSDRLEVHTLGIVGIDQKDGWTWVVIQMPPTIGPGESVFLVMLQRPGQARYFTLDRTRDERLGALIEWRRDGSHQDRGKAAFEVGKLLEAVGSALVPAKAGKR